MRVIDLREQFVVYVIYSGDGWRYRGGGGGFCRLPSKIIMTE